VSVESVESAVSAVMKERRNEERMIRRYRERENEHCQKNKSPTRPSPHNHIASHLHVEQGSLRAKKKKQPKAPIVKGGER
jgi:hypothetical protein